jgi:rubrerythrin
MTKGKEISQKLSTLLEKLQAGYKNIEQQINASFEEDRTRIRILEERVTVLEGQVSALTLAIEVMQGVRA